jgi:hypothetical protein
MCGRRWFAVLAGFALALTCLGTLGVASAAPEEAPSHARAAKTTRLTLALSADEVAYATRVTVSGKLTAGRKGLKRQKVVLKQRVGASRTWTKVATLTTNRRGTWRKVVEARVRSTYIAVYKGSTTYAPSKATKRGVDVFAPLTDVVVSPGNRDAYLGEAWTWTGRTAPELAGSSVSIVRGPFRTSTTVEKAIIGPGGAIAISHRMSVAGTADYWLSVDSSALMWGASSAATTVRTRREGAPTAPSITTTALPTVEVHVPYQTSLAGGGGELTWSVVGGALPPGLSLADTGLITGGATATGSWSFTVRAANPVGAATRTLELTSLPGTLTVTTYPLYDAAVGRDYPDSSFTSGGEQAMYCTPCPLGADWTITAGSLPPGMGFDYDDLLEETYVYGRPTQAGLYHFTATAVADGHSGSKQFSLRVVASAGDLLRIDYNGFTERIPNATLGQPYSHQLTAGGAPGVTWSALSPLPPGLTLSPGGLLAGTPTVAGHGWIAFAATDGTRYDWQALELIVDTPP